MGLPVVREFPLVVPAPEEQPAWWPAPEPAGEPEPEPAEEPA